MQKLVRELSDSVRKQGVLSRFGLESAGNVGSSATKRKIADQGGLSSKKIRDNCMGMFTPPSFNLGSQEDGGSESPVDGIASEEVAMPHFPIDVEPLAWSPARGIVLCFFVFKT
jgi:hypothetical protein